jgi:LysR family transcriptional regulator, hypochlorite-specific transcription factor HypT
MHLKLLEDLVALVEAGSFTAAAKARNVTHPAFGRRIRSLEDWVGVPLVDRQGGQHAVKLTSAGIEFLNISSQTIAGLTQARLQAHRGNDKTITLCTGRTLARTMAADWMSETTKHFKKISRKQAMSPANSLPIPNFTVSTKSLQAAAAELSKGNADFLLAYEHTSIDLKLDPVVFDYKTIGRDKLVAVSATHAAIDFLQYSPGLALRSVLDQGLKAPRFAESSKLWLNPKIECDSPDALQSFALKGMGIAWLPWSMVAADCREKRLVLQTKSNWQIPFEIRLYRKRAAMSRVCEKAWEWTESIT